MNEEKEGKTFKIVLTKNDLNTLCNEEYESIEVVLTDIIDQAKAQGYKREV